MDTVKISLLLAFKYPKINPLKKHKTKNILFVNSYAHKLSSLVLSDKQF